MNFQHSLRNIWYQIVHPKRFRNSLQSSWIVIWKQINLWKYSSRTEPTVIELSLTLNLWHASCLIVETIFTEKYEDNPEFLGYINKLGSMTIEQLRELIILCIIISMVVNSWSIFVVFHVDKEKKLLDDEMSSIDGQMRQLASNHYKTFIHTADTSRTIHKNVCITVSSHLKSNFWCNPKNSIECYCRKYSHIWYFVNVESWETFFSCLRKNGENLIIFSC